MKYKLGELFTALLTIVLLVSVNKIYADSKSNQINYSPDHWPSRWSSAIHQQQTGKFPIREKEQAPLAELPEAVSENDLFYSQSRSIKPRVKEKLNTYDSRYLQQPMLGNRGQYAGPSRRYSNRPNGFSNYYGNRAPYMTGPYNPSMTVMDPVLGHPGGGIPVVPGIPGYVPMGMAPFGYPYGGVPLGGTPFGMAPYGYPYGGMPFGTFGSPGMWNQPFGIW